MASLSAASVAAGFGWDGEALARWLADLEAAGPPTREVRLPAHDDAAALLRRLTVSNGDIADVLRTMPRRDDPAWWWLLERGHARLCRRMAEVDAEVPWPPLPDPEGPRGALYLVHLFLSVFDDVRAWHRAHGVSEDASWACFRGLGRAMRIHRELHGSPGVFEHGWMALPFRACLYELGRLQYTPFHIGGRLAERLAGAFPAGEPTIGIHIPASGPMRPADVDASLRWAREVFVRPEPFGPCRIAVCGSWLLDDQWAEYLGPDSNILHFQRRFHMLPGGGNADGSMFSHVLRIPPTEDLDALPQRTTLERAIVAHWREGRHWKSRTGWLAL